MIEKFKVMAYYRVPLHTLEESVRQCYVKLALESAGGNVCKAAKALGIHRNTLARILGRY